MIKKYRQIVRSILTADIKSRCSDRWLYTKVLEVCEIDDLTADEKRQLLYLLRKAHLPNYASVMRARQYIQSTEPELSEHLTRERRQELEKEYRREFKR
ncbi:MAG: hypothetical protein IJ643_06680 [Eubacterium sp.]|nr:hypothetical protein [Eubacterium sp.]